MGEHFCIYCGEPIEHGAAVRLVSVDESADWSRQHGRKHQANYRRHAHAYRIDCSESWEDVETVDAHRQAHRDLEADFVDSPEYDADDYEVSASMWGDLPTLENDDA